jgi:hypothetical protein
MLSWTGLSPTLLLFLSTVRTGRKSQVSRATAVYAHPGGPPAFPPLCLSAAHAFKTALAHRVSRFPIMGGAVHASGGPRFPEGVRHASYSELTASH